MRKLTTIFIFSFVCLIIAGQIIVPINKERIEDYGVWKYDDLVIDTFITKLNGRFIASDTCSIWGTYEEFLQINDSAYDCIYEDLPMGANDSIFYPGDTLCYQEIFMPISETQNSGRILSFNGSDTIDFSLVLPQIDIAVSKESQVNKLLEFAYSQYFNGNNVSSARIIRKLCEMSVNIDTLQIRNLMDSIKSNLYPSSRQNLYLTTCDLVRSAEYLLLNEDSLSLTPYLRERIYSCIVSDSLVLAQDLINKSFNIIENHEEYLPDYEFLLEKQAELYIKRGEVDKGIKQFEDLITLHKSNYGVDYNWLRLNNNLAFIYTNNKLYSESLDIDLKLLQNIALYEEDYIPQLFLNLCYDYCHIGDFDNAINYGERCLNCDKISDRMLYELYYLMGDIYSNGYINKSKAEPYFDKWSKLSSEIDEVPETFIQYISKRELITAYYIYQSNYPKAINNELHNIYEISEILGNDCWEYAMALNNLANAYAGNSNLEYAVLLSQKSFDLRNSLYQRDSTSIDHDGIIRSCINLSGLYREIQDYEKAIYYADYAIEHTDSTNDLRVQALLKRAYIDFELDQREIGYDRFIEAVHVNALLKRDNGEERYYHNDLNLNYVMARFALEFGSYKEALSYYKENLQIIDKYNLGAQYYFNNLLYIIRCHYFMNKLGKVNNQISEARDVLQRSLKDAFIRLTAQQRQDFMKSIAPYIHELSAYAYLSNSKTSGELLFDFALLRKGILLRAETDLSDFIDKTGDVDIKRQYEHYLGNLNLLLSNNAINRDSLSKENEKIEYNLINALGNYGDYTSGLLSNWQDIKQKLNHKDIAIEFICLDIIDESENLSKIYLAVIVDDKMKRPLIIEIHLDENTSSENNIILSDRELYSIVWEPLFKYFKDKTNIYFACDGILHNLGIEYALMDDDKRICDDYNLFRLTSTRELLKENQQPLSSMICMYGGINYDMTEGEMANQNTVQEENFYASRAGDFRDFRFGVRYLPYTLSEVQAIDSLFADKGYTILKLTQNDGTEESFKNLDNSCYQIIHLATHGFYWDEEVAKKRNYISFLSTIDESPNAIVTDNALLRSGLMLSGANNTLKGDELPHDIEDGVLTALEISSMKFKNLDLVVMSACQTGLGETTGEGVFGLQRGFKLAGANSLLMSLWKVDDQATCLLMTEFYKNLLSGKTKQESLYLAQKVLRESTKYSDPEYWAAFILLDALN